MQKSITAAKNIPLKDEQHESSETCINSYDATDILDAINKEILKNNSSFQQMSKMEKRVALAKDVIASIKSKKYKVKTGYYLQLFNTKGGGIKRLSKENYEKEEIQCEVCAIGSLFVSNFKQNSSLKITSNDDKMINSLKGIYSENELRLLEYFFEAEDVYDIFDENVTIHGKVYDFYREYMNSESRLLAMMENIISNEGNFIYKDIKI